MIRAPFSQYHRAKLERLVKEGFEAIERNSVEKIETGHWGEPSGLPMDIFDFQMLMAADHYLRTTGRRAA